MVGRQLTVAVVAFVLLASTSLLVPVSSGDGVEPVAFEDTFTLGLTDETLREADRLGASVPKVEAYYSNYEYVVGFYSVEAYAAEQMRTGHRRQFGRPIAVFVSDYTDTNVSLTEDGLLRTTRHVGFEPAEETFVVVNSEARLPGGPVSVPFARRDAAVAFTDRYGGSVVPWSEAVAQAEATKPLTTERFRSKVDTRSNWADDAATARSTLSERRTSVVVGRDAPTVEAAIRAAPPNTTVEVPAGTYRVRNLTVNKSITVDGAGNATRIRGNGNGTVIRVTASRAALTDVQVAGVGDIGSRRLQVNESRLEGLEWSENVQLAYGRGDAAIKVLNASQSLVENVHVRTPSSGVIVLHSRGTVIRESDITVTEGPEEGFMGLVSMYDPIVVEDSSFDGGRDGIYTHRADGIVVRNNEFADGRYGVHEMYTSRSLVANNTVRDERIGVIVMTRPTDNAVVRNDIRDSEIGLSVSGSDSYYAGNTLVGNGRGLDVLGTQSLIERNTISRNRIGVRDGTSLPTNVVVGNDIVDNGRPATAGREPLRVYTSDGRGNYWGPVPGADSNDDGSYERAYRPTGTVGSLVAEEPGAWTLARSPAYTLARGLQRTVPGLRSSGIIDTAPRTRPERPGVLASLRNRTNATARFAP